MIPERIRIGPRTIKTAAAVIIAMVIVHFYGTTASRLTFAMLGAMAAVEQTFKDSLRSCMAQIVGVAFGSVVGVVLLATIVGVVGFGERVCVRQAVGMILAAIGIVLFFV